MRGRDRATRLVTVWREDHLGDRDLARWPSAVGRAVLRMTTWLLGRPRGVLQDRLPATDLPWLVLALTAGVGGALVVGATAASAELYEAVAERDGFAELDRPVLDWMLERRTPALDTWVTHYTDLGSTAWMSSIVVVAALLLSWWWRRWTPALLLAITAAGSVLMTIAGKDLVDRVRPPRSLAVPPFETSPSFPSGHTLNSWVLLLLIAYLVSLRTTSRALTFAAPAVALVLAAAMGLSRVYLGHHWLTDVLVGWTLGTAWLAVVVTGHRLALTVRRWTVSEQDRQPDESLQRLPE